jgi:hypothetical protein
LECSGFFVCSPIKDDVTSFYVSRKPVQIESWRLLQQSQRITHWKGIVLGRAVRGIEDPDLEQWSQDDYDTFAGFCWFGDRQLIAELRKTLGD